MPDILKALNEATATAGGYMVPIEFARQVYEKVVQQAVSLPMLEQVAMARDLMYFPTVTTGSTAYIVAENATITAADLAFGRLTLDTKKFASLVPLSSELLDDSDPAIAGVIMNQMAKDLALKLDQEILTGTGSAFTGFTENTDVNKVTSATTTGEAITIAKIADAVKECEVDGHHPSHLFIHPRTLNVVRKLTDSAGRYLFDEAMFGSPILKTGAVGTIWGLQVVPTNALSTTVTKSTTTTCTDLIVAEANACGIFGKRRDMQFNKMYNITTDSWTLQANLRAAFTVKYPNSVCIIEDVLV